MNTVSPVFFKLSYLVLEQVLILNSHGFLQKKKIYLNKIIPVHKCVNIFFKCCTGQGREQHLGKIYLEFI